MSISQIAFVYGDHAEQKIAAVQFDKNAKSPFAELQSAAVSGLDFGNHVNVSDIYFMYEDDDGDLVKILNDADANEAFAVHEDAGQDDILLTVKLHSLIQAGADESKSDAEDAEAKEDGSRKSNTFFSETFVFEFCSFLNDPAVRQVIPEVSANLAAAVLKKASAKEMFDIIVSNSVLKQQALLTQEWPFGSEWAIAIDQWISSLTDDQLGKVAFQIPLLVARLAAKREKLHKALFVKKKSLGKVLKIKQFNFGSVDLAALVDRISSGVSEPIKGHVGTECSICKASPIEGARYRCMVCPAFDMCEACEAKALHPADHATMKFRNSEAGFVGLSHATALYGKKALKHQIKALKHEARLAKKGGKHHKHHHGSKHHLPPTYVQSGLSFADMAAASSSKTPGPAPQPRGFYGPVENANSPKRLY